ncbi:MULTISPECIES: hypothetical protein [unclassified Crossiella]|uniref:hypothetical protein n=1 Tax=unclassified Crossiella TaxID=2620835 RepID=UPI001FFE3EBF|nr:MULTISPECIES: hypothetical protein [unclassified Crossiella]MCK2240971.1 hypothetical protein [Crossiella sp. S99.2]MCK2253885.1 hypothetical protein [Crossiella sp. S99.1]
MDADGPTGDTAIDAALAELAATDPTAAEDARAALESLTWGQGLEVLSLHGVADFLWYRLPVKWMSEAEEKRRVAAALGQVFEQVGLPRYATICAAPLTATILDTYDQQGESAGLAAYQRALAASGVQPPEIPGLLVWGTMLGTEEAAAYWAVTERLELALTAGEFTPGARGWRSTAQRITAEFLTADPVDFAGGAWLDRIQTERLGRWADSRSTVRATLTSKITNRLITPIEVPADADHHLAPVRWLLELAAAEGVPLTATGTLARAVVGEGARRFDWLTFGKQPRSESDLPEAWTLRTLAVEIGAVRRRGRRLLLTPAGRRLLTDGTPALWQAVMPTLLPKPPAEAAAAEIALLLTLTGNRHGYDQRNRQVADALAGEGWRSQSTGGPIEPDQIGWLLGELARRLDLLRLTEQRRLGDPHALTPAGTAAAYAALRHRALAPRDTP